MDAYRCVISRSFRETLDRAFGSRQNSLGNKSLNRFWKHKEKVERDELNDTVHQKVESLKQKSNNHFTILQKFRSKREAKRRLAAEQKAKHQGILERKVRTRPLLTSFSRRYFKNEALVFGLRGNWMNGMQ